MPSPIGHSIAGLCGFMLIRGRVSPSKQAWLLLGSVFIANLPDFDVIPGLILGDPRVFHHQGIHSLFAGVMVGLIVGGVAMRRKLNEIEWGTWGGCLYLSHVLLDLLVNDPSVPYGVQLLWPFSQAYFISPVTPFDRFDYFDPEHGIIRTMLSLHNLGAMMREAAILAPILGLTWYISGSRRGTLGDQA